MTRFSFNIIEALVVALLLCFTVSVNAEAGAEPTYKIEFVGSIQPCHVMRTSELCAAVPLVYNTTKCFNLAPSSASISLQTVAPQEVVIYGIGVNVIEIQYDQPDCMGSSTELIHGHFGAGLQWTNVTTWPPNLIAGPHGHGLMPDGSNFTIQTTINLLMVEVHPAPTPSPNPKPAASSSSSSSSSSGVAPVDSTGVAPGAGGGGDSTGAAPVESTGAAPVESTGAAPAGTKYKMDFVGYIQPCRVMRGGSEKCGSVLPLVYNTSQCFNLVPSDASISLQTVAPQEVVIYGIGVNVIEIQYDQPDCMGSSTELIHGHFGAGLEWTNVTTWPPNIIAGSHGSLMLDGSNFTIQTTINLLMVPVPVEPTYAVDFSGSAQLCTVGQVIHDCSRQAVTLGSNGTTCLNLSPSNVSLALRVILPEVIKSRDLIEVNVTRFESPDCTAKDYVRVLTSAWAIDEDRLSNFSTTVTITGPHGEPLMPNGSNITMEVTMAARVVEVQPTPSSDGTKPDDDDDGSKLSKTDIGIIAGVAVLLVAGVGYFMCKPKAKDTTGGTSYKNF